MNCLYTASGNVNGRAILENSLAFSKRRKKKSNMQFPYNPETAFQGIYNSEMKTYFQTKSGT